MTSELQWVDFKGGINDQIKKSVVKKDSYSSDSLDEFCEENTPFEREKSKISSDENSELDMSNDKSLSRSSSVISSVNDNTSITSHYSLEIVEETEALQTENITESVDIRISPSNSIMSFDCSDNFYSEFSLVANVEVQIPEINHAQEESTKFQDSHADLVEFEKDELRCEENANFPDIDQMVLTDNDTIDVANVVIRDNNKTEILDAFQKGLNDPHNYNSRHQHVAESYNGKMPATKLEKKVTSSIEKKIAEEIKEFKKREEDLRTMREKLAKEMAEKTVNKDIKKQDATNSGSPAISKPEKAMSSVSNCNDTPVPKKCTTTKAENTYVKACVFAVKRKDISIKVDSSDIVKTSSAIPQQESPVEREIRIVKEREEELRREREQALKSKLELNTFSSELSTPETDVDSALSVCSDSSFDSVTKLAPLFSRTISPDMSNSNGFSVYSSSAGSLCSLESLSQREKLSVGKQTTKGSSNGSILSPSPDFTQCKPVYPFTSPNERRSKNIDMERFISSKGKEIKFKGNLAVNSGFTPSYYEIKPPQVKKGEEITCKRFITAATKIQNELKEMQEREEQLKKERENIQQELKNQDNRKINESETDNANSSGNQTESSENISYSDFPEDNIAKDYMKQDSTTNHNRRRSILIDEWEQRIQQSILQP